MRVCGIELWKHGNEYVIIIPQAKHAVTGNMTWGVDGDTGSIVDMSELGVWDPLSVKVQTYKTAIEVCVCFVCVSFVCVTMKTFLFQWH